MNKSATDVPIVFEYNTMKRHPHGVNAIVLCILFHYLSMCECRYWVRQEGKTLDIENNVCVYKPNRPDVKWFFECDGRC